MNLPPAAGDSFCARMATKWLGLETLLLLLLLLELSCDCCCDDGKEDEDACCSDVDVLLLIDFIVDADEEDGAKGDEVEEVKVGSAGPGLLCRGSVGCHPPRPIGTQGQSMNLRTIGTSAAATAAAVAITVLDLFA